MTLGVLSHSLSPGLLPALEVSISIPQGPGPEGCADPCYLPGTSAQHPLLAL